MEFINIRDDGTDSITQASQHSLPENIDDELVNVEPVENGPPDFMEENRVAGTFHLLALIGFFTYLFGFTSPQSSYYLSHDVNKSMIACVEVSLTFGVFLIVLLILNLYTNTSGLSYQLIYLLPIISAVSCHIPSTVAFLLREFVGDGSLFFSFKLLLSMRFVHLVCEQFLVSYYDFRRLFVGRNWLYSCFYGNIIEMIVNIAVLRSALIDNTGIAVAGPVLICIKVCVVPIFILPQMVWIRDQVFNPRRIVAAYTPQQRFNLYTIFISYLVFIFINYCVMPLHYLLVHVGVNGRHKEMSDFNYTGYNLSNYLLHFTVAVLILLNFSKLGVPMRSKLFR
jgi:hypothetical protein